ncbi:hypothetical protein [Nocardia gamkensis]|uniref:hypothetical protein n=1 Tax=Nocardia gamkensis TaxID=352869 RepID=UPI0037C92A63
MTISMEGVSVVRKLIFGATAAAAALALFAGPAQADGWWQYDTAQECEHARQQFVDLGSRVSGCEFKPNASAFGGGDAWGFHIYS